QDEVEALALGRQLRDRRDAGEPYVGHQPARFGDEVRLALESDDVLEELREQDRHAAVARADLAGPASAVRRADGREERARVLVLAVGPNGERRFPHVDDVLLLPDGTARV